MVKRYLVTGGAGFIGSNFILYLLKHYRDIVVVNLDKLTYAGNLENLKAVEKDDRYRFIQGDICCAETVRRLFSEVAFDYVVNFAAESHVDRSIHDPGIFAHTNIMGTLTLLDAAKDAWDMGSDKYREGVKFLQVSTDEVYGSLGPEGFFTEETPLNPRSPYSASKASADMFVKAYADTYRLPVNITRCSNNYGPYQFPEKLIPLMISNCLAHKPLPIYGDGMQVRDWLYVEDHCRAIDMVICGGKPSEVYNIGGHNERYNIDIVKAIIAYIHEHKYPEVSEALIQYVTDRKGHDRRYAIDPAKISAELGWKPTVMFDEGIQKTIRWYLDNDDWVQNVISEEYKYYYDLIYQKR